MKLDHDGMRTVLDAIADGSQVAEAAATVGVSESAIWTAKRQSRIAEDEFDTTRFWLQWRGHLNYFHVLLGVAAKKTRPTEWDPDELPPYTRGLKTPATPEAVAQYVKPEIDPQRPFPPMPTPASPRVRARPDSPLVRDLMARATIKPSNPFPLDMNGRRTMISTGGTRADDPKENVGA